jgi:hypothetical protein
LIINNKKTPPENRRGYYDILTQQLGHCGYYKDKEKINKNKKPPTKIIRGFKNSLSI